LGVLFSYVTDWAFFCLPVKEFYGTCTKVAYFSLINVGSGFHCLLSFLFHIYFTAEILSIGWEMFGEKLSWWTPRKKKKEKRKKKKEKRKKKKEKGILRRVDTPQAWNRVTETLLSEETLLSDGEVLTLPGGSEPATLKSLA